jgi:hypothetical protein
MLLNTIHSPGHPLQQGTLQSKVFVVEELYLLGYTLSLFIPPIDTFKNDLWNVAAISHLSNSWELVILEVYSLFVFWDLHLRNGNPPN